MIWPYQPAIQAFAVSYIHLNAGKLLRAHCRLDVDPHESMRTDCHRYGTACMTQAGIYFITLNEWTSEQITLQLDSCRIAKQETSHYQSVQGISQYKLLAI